MALRVFGAFVLTAAIAVAACGGGSPESRPGGGKVYFAEPKNGATVKSPVNIVFASEMFTIAPVPPVIAAGPCVPTQGITTSASIRTVCQSAPSSRRPIRGALGMGNNSIDIS